VKNITLLSLIFICFFFGPDSSLRSDYYVADFGFTALIVLTLLSVALSITTSLIAPKMDIEEPKPAGLGDFNFPTNLESRYIPVLWGTSRIDGQNITWYGDFKAQELDTGGKTVAYEYSFGFDLALCWGPVDSINAVQVDDGFVMKAGQTLAGNRAPDNGLSRSVGYSDSYTWYVRDDAFFGGQKTGGGIGGEMTFFFGTETQGASSYLRSKFEGQTVDLGDGPVDKRLLIPKQTNICHMVWQGGKLGERANIPQFKIYLSRYPTSLTSAFSQLNVDSVNGQADANPAHVIYEILTDTNWGLGVDTSFIDVDSFIDVARQLYSENNGFSMSVDTPKQAKSIIDLITQQINGVLFQDENGKFKLSLLRRTYRTEDLAKFDYQGSVIVESQISDSANITAGVNAINVVSATLTAAVEVDEWVRVTNVTNSASAFGKVVTKNVSTSTITLTGLDGEDISSVPNILGTAVNATIEKYEKIPELTQSAVINVKTADRQSWAETFNVLQLKYLNRTQDFKETVATAHDMGNLSIQNGKRTVKTYDLQGVRHPNTASVVAQRLLRTHSYPITSINLEVSRRFSSIRPGDLVKVNYPDFGLYDFFLRVLEVGLPSDNTGNVFLRGIRDVFDEPTFGDTIYVGGTAVTVDSAAPNPINPPVDREPPIVNATDIIVSGLPYFFHKLFSDQTTLEASSDTTWHIVPAANNEVTSVRPYELNSVTGQYVPTSVQRPPVLHGRLVANSSMLFYDHPDGSFSYPTFDSSTTIPGQFPVDILFEQLLDQPHHNNTDLVSSGPYGVGRGGNTDPVDFFGNAEFSPSYNNETTGDAVYGYFPYLQVIKDTIDRRDGDLLGDINIRFYTGPDSQFTGLTVDTALQTLSQIKEFGYGLALIRPAWANGDTRFDEIIAFENAMIVPLGVGESILGPGYPQGWTRYITANTNTYVLNSTFPVVNSWLRETTYICLSNIYRGLLDTGIQILNHDSEVFILPTDHILYDEVGQLGTLSDRTYRHQTTSAASLLDLNNAGDVLATAASINRKDLPMVPKKMSSTGIGEMKIWGVNEPEVSAVNAPGYFTGINFPAYTEGVGYNLSFTHFDPQNAASNFVNVNTDTTVANANWKPILRFHLLQDNSTGATEQQRQQTAWARWKEGWMPTTPALRYPEAVEIYGYTNPGGVSVDDYTAEAADEVGFRVSAGYAGTTASTSISGVNLMNLLDTEATNAGNGLSITSGQKYWIEVWIGMEDSNSNQSWGRQRHIIEWTANTNRTP